MTKSTLMEKYPLLSLEIAKSNTECKNTTEVLEYFKNKIDTDAIAKYIATFNHYEHTQSLGEEGTVDSAIVDAQNIIFCFGKNLSNPLMLGVRPRSIAVVEYEDKFIVSFMEAPMAPMSEKMEMWVKQLAKD